MRRSPGAYRSEKRSKEIARKKKQEEKEKRRLARAAAAASPAEATQEPAQTLEPQDAPIAQPPAA